MTAFEQICKELDGTRQGPPMTPHPIAARLRAPDPFPYCPRVGLDPLMIEAAVEIDRLTAALQDARRRLAGAGMLGGEEDIVNAALGEAASDISAVAALAAAEERAKQLAKDVEYLRGNREYHFKGYQDEVNHAAALHARCAELAKWVAHFTRHYETWMDDHGDDSQSYTFSRHTLGELRKARAALAPAGGEGAKS